MTEATPEALGEARPEPLTWASPEVLVANVAEEAGSSPLGSKAAPVGAEATLGLLGELGPGGGEG